MDGCHQCRTLEPKEAMVADLVTKGLVSDFYGMFEVVVNAALPDSTIQDVTSKTSFKIPTDVVSHLFIPILFV